MTPLTKQIVPIKNTPFELHTLGKNIKRALKYRPMAARTIFLLESP